MTHFLSIEDINVSYGSTQVLSNINLTVDSGEFVAVAGPSGCGKTTLLRTIAGLERATSGNIRLGNRMLTTHGIHLAPEKRNIGWVPQDSALFPMLTVAENIAFALAKSPRGVRTQSKSAQVEELLELINMAALRERMPNELSGGQAQRVALARALAHAPQLVLMDEPFAGLDPILRSELRSEVREILSTRNTAALLVTHDQTEALSIADRVALLHTGMIEQFGTPQEVYQTPASIWAADFLGETNVLPATLTAAGAHTLLGNSPVEWMGTGEPEPEFLAMVRPEALRLTPGENWIVTHVHYCGHDALITAVHDSGASVDVRVDAQHISRPGERVNVELQGALLGYPLA